MVEGKAVRAAVRPSRSAHLHRTARSQRCCLSQAPPAAPKPLSEYDLLHLARVRLRCCRRQRPPPLLPPPCPPNCSTSTPPPPPPPSPTCPNLQNRYYQALMLFIRDPVNRSSEVDPATQLFQAKWERWPGAGGVPQRAAKRMWAALLRDARELKPPPAWHPFVSPMEERRAEVLATRTS